MKAGEPEISFRSDLTEELGAASPITMDDPAITWRETIAKYAITVRYAERRRFVCFIARAASQTCWLFYGGVRTCLHSVVFRGP